jgi:hypothetical protein
MMHGISPPDTLDPREASRVALYPRTVAAESTSLEVAVPGLRKRVMDFVELTKPRERPMPCGCSRH